MSGPAQRSRFAVVGGGIVGLAVARELTRRQPGAAVTVLEKEATLAAHQSGHNSGVVHAGLYYRPGSLKARLCRRGMGLLQEFCAEHAIPYHERGKVVVALEPAELPPLRRIHERAAANGVPGVRLLDGAGLREIEPYAAGIGALHSPRTAVVDFRTVSQALAGEVERAGGSIRFRFRVTGIARRDGSVRLVGPDDTVSADHVVVCAGLHADRLAQSAGDGPDPRIVPFRGEYYALVAQRTHLVRGLIYPVPDPRFPFLGVHLTRRVDGAVDVGPNAVLALAREGYRRGAVDLADLARTLCWPGFWKLARAHWWVGAGEIVGSLSAHAFARQAGRYLPELTLADLVPGPAGVRAQAVARDGTLVDDFRISFLGRVVAVRNAPSPAATSSLALAEHICDRIEAGR